VSSVKIVEDLKCRQTKDMATTSIQQTQFITLAIGATAQRMGITATELHNRLKRHGLVRRLLIDCYDTLHAENIDGVVWNVQEALRTGKHERVHPQSQGAIR
jgi:hypothetical protein